MITVAIPTWNGERYIGETLRSILDQGEVVSEIIVSDENSSDKTLEIVRDVLADRARVVVNHERLGLAGNWNQCAQLCRTPLIAIVHQDDRLLLGHLSAHVAAFAARPDLGLVASASTVIDVRGEEVPETIIRRGGLGPVDRVFESIEAVSVLGKANELRCSAVSMRVEAHHQVGGFDPTLSYVVDWIHWLRIARNRPIAWLAAPTVQVRWHFASETHRFSRGVVDLEESERVLGEHLRWMADHSLPTVPIRRQARRRLARAYLNRAYLTVKSGNGPLARECLGRALALWPGVLETMALDPRLATVMAAVAVAPVSAGRWFREELDKS